MSHMSTMKLKVTDMSALMKACSSLGLTIKENERVNFYSDNATGTSIQLPGWDYPIVIKPDGSIKYDNYNERWGDIDKLNELVQQYNYEVVVDQLALEDYVFDEVQEGDEIVIRTIA